MAPNNTRHHSGRKIECRLANTEFEIWIPIRSGDRSLAIPNSEPAVGLPDTTGSTDISRYERVSSNLGRSTSQGCGFAHSGQSSFDQVH